MPRVEELLQENQSYALFVDPRYSSSVTIRRKASYIPNDEVRTSKWVEITWQERNREETVKASVDNLKDQISSTLASAQLEVNEMEQVINELLALPQL